MGKGPSIAESGSEKKVVHVPAGATLSPQKPSRRRSGRGVAARSGPWQAKNARKLCGGGPNPNVIAISRRKDKFPFSASNTNSASTNTYNKQCYFNGGETIRAGTCGAFAYGGSASGDTMLRLFKVGPGPSFTEVASNDNALSPNVCRCGTSSLIKYTVTTAGFYQVRAGCNANGSCGGSVAVYVE